MKVYIELTEDELIKVKSNADIVGQDVRDYAKLALLNEPKDVLINLQLAIQKGEREVDFYSTKGDVLLKEGWSSEQIENAYLEALAELRGMHKVQQEILGKVVSFD